MSGTPYGLWWSDKLGGFPVALRFSVGVLIGLFALWLALQVIFPAALGRRAHPAGALWSSIGFGCAIVGVAVGVALAPEWGWLGVGAAVLTGGLIAAATVMYAAIRN